MTILDNYMFRPLLVIFRLSSRGLKVLLYYSPTFQFSHTHTHNGDDTVPRESLRSSEKSVTIYQYSPPPPNGATAPSGRRSRHYQGFTITLRHTTPGRTLLQGISPTQRPLFGLIRTHNPFKLQTHALDSAAIAISNYLPIHEAQYTKKGSLFMGKTVGT